MDWDARLNGYGSPLIHHMVADSHGQSLKITGRAIFFRYERACSETYSVHLPWLILIGGLAKQQIFLAVSEVDYMHLLRASDKGLDGHPPTSALRPGGRQKLPRLISSLGVNF